MLDLYASLMRTGRPLLEQYLLLRGERGKEDFARIGERMGKYGKVRPHGPLLWLHAASVGEAQSALILVSTLQERTPFKNVLVTTGTVTSANLMGKRLPPGAFHQFFPLDCPQWNEWFLDHWRPDAVVWLESELWPNMLSEIKRRGIPAALVNARLSKKSLDRWKFVKESARTILEAFGEIITQTESDARSFRALGATNVTVGGNLKYSARPLPCDESALTALHGAAQGRALWLYASTHAGEEDIACRIHERLKKKIPSLLTIIAPRHPDRRQDVADTCGKYNMKSRLRSSGEAPQADDDIYIADTMGEMGLFYRLCPVACIGRSFSDDGGGGHNPIEAAQLGCAVLHGPHVQNLAAIYAAMDKTGAALALKDENDFHEKLGQLLADGAALTTLRQKGEQFIQKKTNAIEVVFARLERMFFHAPPTKESPEAA